MARVDWQRINTIAEAPELVDSADVMWMVDLCKGRLATRNDREIAGVIGLIAMLITSAVMFNSWSNSDVRLAELAVETACNGGE